MTNTSPAREPREADPGAREAGPSPQEADPGAREAGPSPQEADRGARTSRTPVAAKGCGRPGVCGNPNGPTPIRLVGGRELLVAPGPPDRRIAAVAGAQHGRIGRGQLLALGITPQMIKTRLRTGLIHQSHRAVYVVGHLADTLLGAETAALLAVGPPVALSHESAGRIWEIWTPAPAPAPAVVHVSVPGERAKSRDGIRVHRSRLLTARDVTLRDGLPVTTPAWTVFDLADDNPVRAVERTLDEALHRRLVTPRVIRDLLARSPGRRGAHILERLIDPSRARGITREAAEERLLGLIRSSNLPDPERNVQLGRFSVDDPLPLVARLARATARGAPADAA